MLSKVLTGEPAKSAGLIVLQDVIASKRSAPTATARQPENVPDRSAEVAALQNELLSFRSSAAEAERAAYLRGMEQGRAEGQAAIDPVLARMEGSIAQTVGLRVELRRAAEKDLVHLALAIAKRVLHRELQVDESALNALARFAFDRLARSEQYRLVTHPRFAASIQAHLPAQSTLQIRVDVDPACLPGTLIIHTEGGKVDASIDTQLEEITKGLTDRIA